MAIKARVDRQYASRTRQSNAGLPTRIAISRRARRNSPITRTARRLRPFRPPVARTGPRRARTSSLCMGEVRHRLSRACGRDLPRSRHMSVSNMDVPGRPPHIPPDPTRTEIPPDPSPVDQPDLRSAVKYAVDQRQQRTPSLRRSTRRRPDVRRPHRHPGCVLDILHSIDPRPAHSVRERQRRRHDQWGTSRFATPTPTARTTRHGSGISEGVSPGLREHQH